MDKKTVSLLLGLGVVYGTMWMTHLINNIRKEGYILDYWRKSICCLCKMGNVAIRHPLEMKGLLYTNGRSSIIFVVVCLPKPIEGMRGLKFSDLFTELPVPSQAAGVVGPLNCAFYIS